MAEAGPGPDLQLQCAGSSTESTAPAEGCCRQDAACWSSGCCQGKAMPCMSVISHAYTAQALTVCAHLQTLTSAVVCRAQASARQTAWPAQRPSAGEAAATLQRHPWSAASVALTTRPCGVDPVQVHDLSCCCQLLRASIEMARAVQAPGCAMPATRVPGTWPILAAEPRARKAWPARRGRCSTQLLTTAGLTRQQAA